MSNNKIDSILNDTKTMSDELQLKLHLGKAELKDEFDGLESAYALLKSKVAQIADVAGDSAKSFE